MIYKNQNSPIFIAEIGMNYNNNFDLNFELIKQAKLSGATFAKFQLGWRDGTGEINQLDEKKIDQLYKWGAYFEIEILFSIISRKAFDKIKKFKPKYIKIASRTLIDDFKLAEDIISLNICTFCSLGMWKENNLPFDKNIYKNLNYFWCLSKYPCFPDDLVGLPKEFSQDEYIGYSDHSIGIETCLIALSRGANVIEKHFTLDKSENIIRDHALSATPDEFRLMVNLGTDIFKKINLGV